MSEFVKAIVTPGHTLNFTAKDGKPATATSEDGEILISTAQFEEAKAFGSVSKAPAKSAAPVAAKVEAPAAAVEKK